MQLLLVLARDELGVLSPDVLANGVPGSQPWHKQQGSDAAWQLAGALVEPALRSRRLGSAQAASIALGACTAISSALQPVLGQRDEVSEAGSAESAEGGLQPLPTPAFVGGAATLAARTACGLAPPEGPRVVDGTVDTLLWVVEGCAADALEVGVQDPAADVLLRVAGVAAVHLRPVLASAVQGQQGAVMDLLSRTQGVMVGAPSADMRAGCWRSAA